MVRDGYYYGLAAVLLALLLGWLTTPWLAIIPLLLGAFFLWFFRDPERTIPATPGAIVSPADGKVTAVGHTQLNGQTVNRISIFLNVFDVHVNRTPIAGTVTQVEYRKGKFANAMGNASSEHNEQNIVTVEGEGQTLIFKQIAGLLARRIVFTPKIGEQVSRGQRIGLMKFGSRMDVIFTADADLKVKLGDRVAGGSDILAIAHVPAAKQSAPEIRTPERV